MSLYCIILPSHFISLYTGDPVAEISVEMIRWYGGLLAVLGVILLRTLQLKDDRLLKPVIEGFLVGDIIHIGAGIYFLVKIQSAYFAIISMILISIFLGIIRIIWLQRNKRSPSAINQF